MPRCNYPTNSWLLDFIVHQKKSRSATTLHVLKPLSGPFPDGSKMMQVGDGKLLMKAQFAVDSFEKLEDSEDEETWERSLIMIKDWDIRLLLNESKEKCEYIIDIKRFVVWYDEKGLSSKNTMIPCESHPEIQETIARIWAENHALKQSASDPQDDTQKTEQTVSSIPLSILLEQIERADDKPSSEEQSFHKISNAGSLITVSVENLQWNFETENLQDFIISPKDAEILGAIVEWQDGYRVPENPSEKSSSENPVSVLAGTSTLKHQCKSSKVSQDAIAVPSTSIEGPERLEEILVSSPNKESEAEEIRLFSLSSVSNEQGKCSPIKELDKSLRKDSKISKNYKNVVPCSGGTNEITSASGVSSSSQLNKDSTETSFEIPLSGKVASNYNANKSTTDELHCSLLDSSLSSEQNLARWNNLDLSSIESEKEFELDPCTGKDQRKETHVSKKIKLTHASGSSCHQGSSDSQGSLLNQPSKELNKKNLSSKPPSLVAISESNRLESNKSVLQEDATNKVSPVYSQTVISDCVVETTPSTKKMNLITNNNGSSNSVCEEETQPIEICATRQELFPKHSACLSLLSSSNPQLTMQNNLNNVRLPKETLEIINAYWSISHNNLLLGQRH